MCRTRALNFRPLYLARPPTSAAKPRNTVQDSAHVSHPHPHPGPSRAPRPPPWGWRAFCEWGYARFGVAFRADAYWPFPKLHARGRSECSQMFIRMRAISSIAQPKL